MRELVLTCLEHEAESLADALLSAGVLSVSVEDADSNTDLENPLYGEPGLEPENTAWRNNMVVAILATDQNPNQVLEDVRDLGGGNFIADDWVVREIPDEDWVALTQSQFGAIQVGDRIWITPSWISDVPVGSRSTEVDPTNRAKAPQHSSDIVRIELDPGMAFGTGSHPTTYLCLDWLGERLNASQTVLDYGCGSGILSIAAKMLGAGRTLAVDIDNQAVLATRDNAKNNNVTVEAMLPDELPDEQFDVVIANILSSPLKVMASMLCGRVVPGGQLVLSGILAWQAFEVIEAYEPWIKLQVWQERDEWVCLHGRKSV